MASGKTEGEKGISSPSYWAAAFRKLFGRGRTQKDGAYWEDQAVRFLRAKGFRTLARNVRMRRGEIDIVAMCGEMTVFVEVKQRKGDEFGGGPYAIDFRKRHRLISAAKEFLSREGLTSQPCRFDTVMIDTSVSVPKFTHIENAFEDERR